MTPWNLISRRYGLIVRKAPHFLWLLVHSWRPLKIWRKYWFSRLFVLITAAALLGEQPLVDRTMYVREVGKIDNCNFGERIGSKDWVCWAGTWREWIRPGLALAPCGLRRNNLLTVPAMLARAVRQANNNQLRTDTNKRNATV